MVERQTELIASYWTIAGDIYYAGPTEISPHDFRERVETAAAVGFCGIGFYHADVMSVAARLGFPTMKKILADNGMKYVELEIIGDWFTTGARRERSDRMRLDLLRAAEQLDVGCVKAFGDPRGGDWPTGRLIEEFGTLCSQAAKSGTRIALEYMPFTNINTLDRALEIVRGAGSENGGLTVDIWHTVRGGVSYGDIAKIPSKHIFIVEIDDAAATPIGPLSEDTNNERRLCGQGVFDIPGFLQAIELTGYHGPIGVEILSNEQRRRPLSEAASLAFKTAMEQVASRSPPAR
jgi:sugar phosphate isomerase/epimerase